MNRTSNLHRRNAYSLKKNLQDKKIGRNNFFFLACSGCNNKISETRWLKKHKSIFSQFCSLRSPRSRYGLIWFLMRALFLVYRWLPSRYLLTWSFFSVSVSKGRRRQFSWGFSVRISILSALLTAFKIDYLLKTLSPNRASWVFRL